MKGYLDDIRPLTHRGAVPRKTTPPPPMERPPRMEPPEQEERPEPREREPRRIPSQPVHQKYSWGWGRIVTFVILGLAVILGILYGLSYLFRGAQVTITPKSVAGTVNLNLTATNDPTATMDYEVMTVPDSVAQPMTATQTDNASTKATGTVIVYNTQSTDQTLVANTRFADPNGDIFRLQKQVVVPKRTVSGGQTTPGQVTVTLAADVAGPAGNIPLSDFTIVAFKGTAKEKAVYGLGKTAFTGGSTGQAYYLSDTDYNTAVTGLSGKLNAKLHDESLKQIPAGYVLLPNSLIFIPDDSNKNPGPSQTSNIVVTYSGTMRGVIIKKSELEEAYINSILADESVTADQVTFEGEDALVLQSGVDLTQPTLPATIPFTVNGDLLAVWNVDKSAVTNALLGVTRQDFTARMQTFPSVKQAELVLRPFWMNKLPTDPKKISITVVDPGAR